MFRSACIFLSLLAGKLKIFQQRLLAETNFFNKKNGACVSRSARIFLSLLAGKLQKFKHLENISETTRLRACLHGGGGPQVGEVTRLAVVEKWPAFTCKLTTPGSRGDFT